MHHRKTTILFIALALSAVTLSACGRKGDLDRPGAPVVNRKTPAGTVEKKPEPVADKPFILDPLL